MINGEIVEKKKPEVTFVVRVPLLSGVATSAYRDHIRDAVIAHKSGVYPGETPVSFTADQVHVTKVRKRVALGWMVTSSDKKRVLFVEREDAEKYLNENDWAEGVTAHMQALVAARAAS